MSRFTTNTMGLATIATVMVLSAGCLNEQAYQGTEDFPRHTNNLLPDPIEGEAQIGVGLVTGEGLEQPIAFPHYTHVTDLGMQCEYCHQAARKSIHGGVPQTATCMNCHKYVKTDSPEIQKVKASYDSGNPISWKKVHDLPDYVHFAHKRHVQAGVDCTECHGLMGLQGQPTTWTETVKEYNEAGEVTHVENVAKEGIRWPVVRETTMQMGWCLDCHGGHPSIDDNYGEEANLRRAELKDCWTCHK